LVAVATMMASSIRIIRGEKENGTAYKRSAQSKDIKHLFQHLIVTLFSSIPAISIRKGGHFMSIAMN
jgi:hypothetical protein